ncbi:MAG TPA: CpaF family protein [Candidatus Binataceae bacterium]|nr:CpaF family protein [Candidatus Binataceae bacterium]
MKLTDRLSHIGNGTPQRAHSFAVQTARRPKGELADTFQQFKLKVHNRLFETLDVTRLENLDAEVARVKVAGAISEACSEDTQLITDGDRERLIEEITNELLGLGPLEPLLWDDSITDILVNGPNHVYIEREGKLQPTGIAFQDEQHLMLIIDRVVSRVHRRIDEASPMVDARLPDGSRINAIIPPLALDGPALSIRRFGNHRLSISELINRGTLNNEAVEFIEALVRARLNMMIIGGTGSGKTTLLNCLSSFIPEDERIVTIEDSAELMLQQQHVVRLETRPPNIEGHGEVTQRDLVRNSLRMRPDRIIVGEARGAEVYDMLQAMSTGHDGSLTTLHANNPRDSLGRLEMMMLLWGQSMPERAMRQQISAALNIVVHVSRLSDGTRKVLRISEITGMEGDVVMMQDLWDFVRTGTTANGRIIGNLRATGIRSVYLERLEGVGYRMDREHARGVGA